jgi:hypothetical protein
MDLWKNGFSHGKVVIFDHFLGKTLISPEKHLFSCAFGEKRVQKKL